METRAPHQRQRPLRRNQETIGMLSYQAMVRPQSPQRERGFTTERSFGQR